MSKWYEKAVKLYPKIFDFKVGLSPSKQICVICIIENLLKMIKKNAFYFIVKALLLRLFGHTEKTAWLER